MRTNFSTTALLCGAVIAGASSCATEPAKPESPNVIVFLIDDTGWNALSQRMDSNDPGSGSTYFETPNMDALAQSGARFSYAYSSAPTSGPSRHCIQYGRSATSLNIYGESPDSYLRGNDEESMMNVLKANRPEYATAHLGKWHITRTPEKLGYDLSDGSTMNKEGNSKDPKDPKLVFSMSRRANEFISEQAQKDRPFYLQVSYYANHLDYQALEQTIAEFNDKSDNATEYHNSPLWAAMNKNLDSGIGSVLNHIKKLGIDDNTYIILTADNGYEDKFDTDKVVCERGFYKAYPLLSHKYMLSEGGVRVPFIISGPGVKAGLESDVPVIGYDIYPTVMDILGISDKTPKIVEGGSLLPLVTNQSNKVIRKNPFFVFKYSKTFGLLDIAIVQGHNKLLKEIYSDEIHLWDLKADQGEQNNLVEKNPAMAKDLYDKMTKYFKDNGWDESQAGPLPELRNKKKFINWTPPVEDKRKK